MSRHLLHKKDLDSFVSWCATYGISTRSGKGDYQVMQVNLHGQWYAIYERDDTHAGNELVHFSTPEKLAPIIRNFLRDKKIKKIAALEAK